VIRNRCVADPDADPDLFWLDPDPDLGVGGSDPASDPVLRPDKLLYINLFFFGVTKKSENT
jgi:hypothetical protein